MVKTANNDGAEKEVYSIKETSSLQGCSKGWYSLNGGGNDYDGGRIPRVGYGDRDFDKLGGVYLIEGGRYDIQRPSDCVERIASIKRNDAGSNPQDVTSCENAVGASMLPAGSSAVGKPQRECACLLPDDLSAYRATGPAEFGGTAGGLGSWVCLLDDGDSTKGEMFLPVPKKSGVYKADGPSAEKPKLSPEEKAKCKAD